MLAQSRVPIDIVENVFYEQEGRRTHLHVSLAASCHIVEQSLECAITSELEFSLTDVADLREHCDGNNCCERSSNTRCWMHSLKMILHAQLLNRSVFYFDAVTV